MSLRIKWTRRALARLDHIGVYIARHDQGAAARVIARIQSIVETMPDYPLMGKVGRVAGTREMVLSDIPYIVAYRAKENEIEILTILHTSQRWPKSF
ncbi:type II toxin-antitoxin system RelE/ParE family toxin [Rhizobium sp. WYCCWR 11279]|uniref:Type II toxin-antitoxin system RelE/ParE family toxin n=1 Tax=Rhizobium changzhiense TaxID=2692317 RepID=A0A7Z0RJV1_9HYPH|nr:type II toxin-antitoxin system RelE/ParE family toxin [Rhizobium changzhiense]NNU49800.1 type II toxin-antitoxin system RelE/ParE family toxin [Rhizobium changzhiense]NZD61553.1 type II toxin-antitoxin system RelE/ParE family toxin [Rhizobium changzhiense]